MAIFMKCPVCGVESEAGARYCSTCGKALTNRDGMASKDKQFGRSHIFYGGEKNKSKKQSVVIISAVLVVALGVAAVFLGFNFGKNKADLNKEEVTTIYMPAIVETTTQTTTSPSVTAAPTTAVPTQTQPAKPSVPSFAYNDNTPDNNASSQFLFDSANQYITTDYLSQCTRDEVVIILNEMYARHGYIFKDAELREYFNSQSWYSGTEPSMEVAYSRFNAIEIKNVDTIVAYQRAMGWRN